MTLYPVELNVAGWPVLVVGGGSVAARRVTGLLEAGAAVRVVSPAFVLELQQMSAIERQVGAYSPEMLGPARLVFACTDDPALNARIAEDARAAGCWCNIADDPRASDFLVPALLRRGRLTVAIGTAGASPPLAARLRDELGSHFEPDLGMLVDELQRARETVQALIEDRQVRRTVLTTLAGEASVELLRSAGPAAWRDWLNRVIQEAGEQSC